VRGATGYEYEDGGQAPRREASLEPGGSTFSRCNVSSGLCPRWLSPSSGLGGRRRSQSPRRLRPHSGQRRARPLPPNRRRRGQFRRRFRVRLPRRQVGQKRAREVFFAGLTYDAEEAYRMGMSTPWCPMRSSRRWRWSGRGGQRQEPHVGADAQVRLQLADDGLVGQQLFAGEATRLAYMTEEAAEGRDAFLARRPPDWSSFPWYY